MFSCDQGVFGNINECVPIYTLVHTDSEKPPLHRLHLQEPVHNLGEPLPLLPERCMARLRKLDPLHLLDSVEQRCHNGVGHVTAFTIYKKGWDFDEMQPVFDVPVTLQDIVSPKKGQEKARMSQKDEHDYMKRSELTSR